MDSLISFVLASPSCLERETSQKFKMKIYVRPESNLRLLAFPPGALDSLAIATDAMMRLNPLQNPYVQ